MSCRHPEWKESERFYAAPPMLDNVRGASTETAQRFVFGVTTILYRCVACGETKSKEILGKSVSGERTKA